MNERHHPNWPPQVPMHLTLPETNIFYNAEVSAARFPHKPFIVFYDTPVTFGEFKDEAERIAGFLQQECHVKAGDRVLLYMQNSPQWIIAYYGILRANAVVVPVNPMNMSGELAHYIEDSGATTIIAPQCLFANVEPLIGTGPGQGIEHAIVATYSDYLKRPSPFTVPEFVAAPRKTFDIPGVTPWYKVLERRIAPGPLTTGPDDLCVMPYTSGTTGKPKGCMHTHRSVMSTLLGGCVWFSAPSDGVFLSILPFFHVTGMQGGMNSAVFSGATIVLLPRWDREAAALCMQKYRVTAWQSITAMMVDFLSNPKLGEYDLSSLTGARGGGAAMPDAIARKLKSLTGLDYVEGYGMSETIAGTHINPPHRPKPQCLGIPLQAPQLVRRLILVGTGPRGGEGMQPMPPEAAKIFSAQYNPPEELWLAVHFSPSPSGQAAGREFLKRKHLRVKDRDPEPSDRVGPAQVAAVIRYSEGRVGKYDYLKQIKQPTLVVNGDNDVIVPTVNSYHLQQNLPNASLILYPDTNHGSQYQYPELFVEQVNQFLSWGLSKPNGNRARLSFPALPPGEGVDE